MQKFNHSYGMVVVNYYGTKIYIPDPLYFNPQEGYLATDLNGGVNFFYEEPEYSIFLGEWHGENVDTLGAFEEFDFDCSKSLAKVSDILVDIDNKLPDDVVPERTVCAANRSPKTGEVALGTRHCDDLMRFYYLPYNRFAL